MRFIKVLLFAVLILLFATFVAQNVSTVSVSFLHYTLYMPLFLLVLVSAFMGFILPALYLSLKVSSKSRWAGLVDRAIRSLYTGYVGRSADTARGIAKGWEVGSLIYARACLEKGEHPDVEGIKRDEGLLDGFLGSELLKRKDLSSAKPYLQEALRKDPNNLLALKAYRDLCYLENRLDECIKQQEAILQKCERWERDTQKAILAELMCLLVESSDDLKSREATLEKAHHTYRTPLVYASYMLHLLETGEVKEAKKHLEKAFKERIHNEVIGLLLSKEDALTKLVDIIEERKDEIEPQILAMVYMRLNMMGRLKDMENSLRGPIGVIAKLHTSHTPECKSCKELLLELYKLWQCECGRVYNQYTPYCSTCNRWGKINLRRDSHAG